MEGNRLIATKKIIVVSRQGCENQVESIKKWASKEGIEFLAIQTGENIDENNGDWEGRTIGITIGGDGTFLEGVRIFSPRKIPFIGVGSGTLSFLSRVEPEEIFDALEEILKGGSNIDELQMVSVKVDSFEAEGLNEVVIGHVWPKKPTERKISSIDVFAGGEHIGKYDGTGIAVTTPTGSTGLSLSAGGPIHYPMLNETIQLTPLHTHNIGVRPLVFGAGTELKIIPDTEVYVLVDGGRATNLLKTKKVITITGSKMPAYLIKTSQSRGFFDRLGTNLGWGIGERTGEVGQKNEYGEKTFEEVALELARNAALGAGDVLRELHRKEEIEVFENSKGGKVTEADYLSENIITSLIRNKFPDHDIISEETVWEDNNSKYRWVIDPLDGTGNFIHKNPNYSVSVALLEENDPLVGVIYIPEIDQLYSAVRGGNAMVNGNIIKTTIRGEIRESMLITGHDPKGELLSSLYPVVKGVRRYGSAAINLAYLACGSADVVWEWDTNPWDVAAGILIVECAGGRVTKKNGEEYILDFKIDNVNEMLASNGQLHSNILVEINRD